MTRDMFGHAIKEREARVIEGPTLDLVLHAESQTREEALGAILVSKDGRESNACWVQKRAVLVARGSLETLAARRDGQRVRLPVIAVTMPEALAREKGLL